MGVLGGMGPLATVDFYAKLTRLTPARVDQDHLRVIIDSNPKIPDRTAGIEGRGADPVPALVASARGLEQAGAGLIAIPCNSAHAYLPAIRRRVRVRVLDIMDEVARRAARLRPRPRAVGLLATPGTMRAGLYHRALGREGLDVVVPRPDEEAALYRAINAVKAGRTGNEVRATVRRVAAALVRRRAEAIVLGCTELPLVMGKGDVRVPVLDATEILAAAALREARMEEFSPRQARWYPGSQVRGGRPAPARRG